MKRTRVYEKGRVENRKFLIQSLCPHGIHKLYYVQKAVQKWGKDESEKSIGTGIVFRYGSRPYGMRR